jgi:hypothetical protein
MHLWQEAVLGAVAGASLLAFLKQDWSLVVAQVLLLVTSLLFGAVIAALFFTASGWLAALLAAIGFVVYLLLRRRRRRVLLNVELSPQRRVEAEALIARARRGDLTPAANDPARPSFPASNRTLTESPEEPENRLN